MIAKLLWGQVEPEVGGDVVRLRNYLGSREREDIKRENTKIHVPNNDYSD